MAGSWWKQAQLLKSWRNRPPIHNGLNRFQYGNKPFSRYLGYPPSETKRKVKVSLLWQMYAKYTPMHHLNAGIGTISPDSGAFLPAIAEASSQYWRENITKTFGQETVLQKLNLK